MERIKEGGRLNIPLTVLSKILLKRTWRISQLQLKIKSMIKSWYVPTFTFNFLKCGEVNIFILQSEFRTHLR